MNFLLIPIYDFLNDSDTIFATQIENNSSCRWGKKK